MYNMFSLLLIRLDIIYIKVLGSLTALSGLVQYVVTVNNSPVRFEFVF